MTYEVLVSPVDEEGNEGGLRLDRFLAALKRNAFLIAGITALVIAIFTIGYQSIKSAIANPVNSLRTE